MKSWLDMSMELTGQVPVDLLFARTLVNRAWVNVQRKHLWSFLWGKRAIPTPSPVSAGTVTVVGGDPAIVGDAAASAAWATLGLINPITQRQFRVGTGTIYNIVSYDTTSHAPFGTLTLDQNFVDQASASGVLYDITQFYYLAPVIDFLWWESIVDPISGYAMRTTLTNEEVDRKDPQRFQSGWPVGPIPYQVNAVAGPTFGFPMYEFWPCPLNSITYTGSYFRRGTEFVADTDTPSPMLGDDIVVELAKVYAYEWAIAQDKFPAASKKAWQYLLGNSRRTYDSLLNDYIVKDEEFSHRHVINQPEDAYIEALPWVSQREGLGYFPD